MTDEQRALLRNKEAAKRLTDAGVLLMQGDCLELLKDIPDGSVDMVLCDPPYGTTACKWDSICKKGVTFVRRISVSCSAH